MNALRCYLQMRIVRKMTVCVRAVCSTLPSLPATWKKKQWKYPVVSQQIENGKVKMIVDDLTQTNGKCARILERTFYLREQ